MKALTTKHGLLVVPSKAERQYEAHQAAKRRAKRAPSTKKYIPPYDLQQH